MGAAKQHMLEEFEREQRELDKEAQQEGWRDHEERQHYWEYLEASRKDD
jgi:hypothetical protein